VSLATAADPFAALGLPAQPGLTDDDVRAAWRRIAAATHPDRADGGDPERFAGAAAAYTALRTRSGRGEALADLAADARRAGPEAATAFASAGPLTARSGSGPPGGRRRFAVVGLASRIRRGRPVRLALRLVIAAAVGAAGAAVAGTQPATPALVVGAITWLVVTARNDLAPPG
jgi:curved DNA-binding protein CbpA